VTFNDNASLDTSEVSDQRGSFGGIPGGGFTVGGGGLGIVGLILYLIVNGLTGGGASTPQSPLTGPSGAVSAQDLRQECRTGADANAHTECRMVGYVNSVQSYWTQQFRQSGRTYQTINTVLFTGGTRTGCGAASSATGPFYCPNDKLVYLDIGFFDELKSRFGARGGPFAQAYVVAHEYGHHVQDLLGTLDRAQAGNQQGADSSSVRLELQADCYAGVWAHHAAQTTDAQGNRLLTVTDQDINDGLDAAAAVGDDRIQQQAQGRVDPESFTHGTAAQRQKWLREGWTTGDPGACDTFSGSI
jgi:predicted metalloprotease